MAPDVRPWSLSWLRKEFRAKKFKYKQKFIWKVTGVEEVSHGRSELAGLHGLRKHIIEATVFGA